MHLKMQKIAIWEDNERSIICDLSRFCFLSMNFSRAPNKANKDSHESTPRAHRSTILQRHARHGSNANNATKARHGSKLFAYWKQDGKHKNATKIGRQLHQTPRKNERRGGVFLSRNDKKRGTPHPFWAPPSHVPPHKFSPQFLATRFWPKYYLKKRPILGVILGVGLEKHEENTKRGLKKSK